MAIVEVKVPQLSESVAEATMLTWKKKAGDAVAIDEILIEIETDKVVLEVPAPSAGVLAEIVVADGGMVVSDQVIARIDSEGKAAAAAAAARRGSARWSLSRPACGGSRLVRRGDRGPARLRRCAGRARRLHGWATFTGRPGTSTRRHNTRPARG